MYNMLLRGGMIVIILAIMLLSIPVDTTGDRVIIPIVRVDITFKDMGTIPDYNISTNFSFNAYAAGMDYWGSWCFIDANWNVINGNTNASINSTYGRTVRFYSGEKNGRVILKASYFGNPNDTVVFTINSSLCSYFLQPGWNFISIPYGMNLNASMFYEEIYTCTMILEWNASIQQFIPYLPGSPRDFNVSGKAIWVAVTNYSLLPLPGEKPSHCIPLCQGWNMLPWLREKPITAESIYENITGCTIVLKWNASMQNFIPYVNGCPNNFVIRKGEGFVVAVTGESVWCA